MQEEARKKEMKKYNVKPPRDLRSKFELKQESKKEAEKQAEKEKQRKEEEERIAVCNLSDLTHLFTYIVQVYIPFPCFIHYCITGPLKKNKSLFMIRFNIHI